MTIPIIFGYLDFHRQEQWAYCRKPILVCHWYKAEWMKTKWYSKRLFCIGNRFDKEAFDKSNTRTSNE